MLCAYRPCRRRIFTADEWLGIRISLGEPPGGPELEEADGYIVLFKVEGPDGKIVWNHSELAWSLCILLGLSIALGAAVSGGS
jgi:hypothetical protein